MFPKKTMPKISKQKKDRIQEQILHYLFEISPEAAFTNKIARDIARDEEFTKFLLEELKSNKLITEVNKNPNGKDYLRRQRWILSSKTFDIYSKHQNQ